MIDVLDYRFESGDLDHVVSVREYFKEILKVLWKEGELFSGKRPFGNSGWQYDIYAVLIKGGFISGKLDSDGYVDEMDIKAADKFILNQIIERL